MLNSKQLFAKRKAVADAMSAAMKEGNTDDALRYEGEIRALDERLEDALEAEEAAREAAMANPVGNHKKTLAEELLGSRENFNGIEAGFQRAVSIQNAISGLNTPQIYDRDLPSPVAPPAGFLATLPKGTTDGDEHFFKVPVLDNKAAGWTSGNKPESNLTWTEGVAHIETIAHWMPIKRQTAKRYSQLENIVSGSLMLGLDIKCAEYAIRGDNSSGIVGIANTAGILEHTKVDVKNLKDTFAAMKRKVRVATGIAPTHVALSPYAIEELSEEKDSTGRYLFPDIANGGTIAGLTVVEDVNMTDSETEKETALVYNPMGASWDIADPQEVLIGLQNSQLIQNEYTVLAELTAALKVDMPAAFCYCADLGLTIEE